MWSDSMPVTKCRFCSLTRTSRVSAVDPKLTHVDDDPLLGTGADLADDVIPVPADGVEDALVGIRVGLGKGIAAGDLEVLVDSGEDRAVVAHQV